MAIAKPALQKVLPLQQLAERVREMQLEGKRVAHCHGCFDMLHAGHVRHFEQASELADALVVTVTPDQFVNKGPNRPVYAEAARAELVAGLAVVDLVAVNGWESAVATIELLRADVFVKGSEYESRLNPSFVAEAQAVERVGAQVAFTRGFTMSSTAAFKRHAGTT